MPGTSLPAKGGRPPVAREVRIDPLLGPVLRCHGCGEEWPYDDEFFWRNQFGNLRGWCRACLFERQRGLYKPNSYGPDVVCRADVA